jgi:hypothetical protein
LGKRPRQLSRENLAILKLHSHQTAFI